MTKNILVSSFGMTWQLIPEMVGAFLYSRNCDFYKANRSFSRSDFLGGKFENGIDELWLLATDLRGDGKRAKSLEFLMNEISMWIREYKPAENLVVRVWVLEGVNDILTQKDVRACRDMVFKVMALAHRHSGSGESVAVSLAGGRKTMSADMQDAATCFGCGLMMHVVGAQKSDECCGEDVFPVRMGGFPRNELMDEILADDSLYGFEKSARGSMLTDTNISIFRIQPDLECFFLNLVEAKRKEAEHFYSSSFVKDGKEHYDNFPSLYTLRKKDRERLRNYRIGYDKSRKMRDEELLSTMPKADLHCHLGGCLHVADLIEVAKSLDGVLEGLCKTQVSFGLWEPEGPKTGESWKEWRARIACETGVEERYVAPRFISELAKKAGDHKKATRALGKLIYGNEYPDLDRNFVSIAAKKISREGEIKLNLAPYERLGDLQGSALLGHRETLERSLRLLLSNAAKNKVMYLEVRCSPINYASENFGKVQVVKTICSVLDEFPEIKSSIIFIASRHSDEAKIKEGIELYQNLKQYEWFSRYFRGFDLAGDEGSTDAEKFEKLFRDVQKDCLNITIHAGETMPVKSIWQAVYNLNAERIGHGLTLKDDVELKAKFRQRGIGVEMCPSSNYQILGFKDNYYRNNPKNESLRDYPLLDYLNFGLRVCVNTDDPGISNTDMTNELLKAARLTRFINKDGREEYGLSLWEIFALLYNSFDLAFLPFSEKRELLRRMDEQVRNWLKENLEKLEVTA